MTNHKRPKRLTFTRKEIITAIETEPLKSGVWIRLADPNKPTKFAAKAKCKVCALGGVLRRRFNRCSLNFIDDLASDLGYIAGLSIYNWEIPLAQKKYLQALSGKFELLCQEYNKDDHDYNHLDVPEGHSVRSDLIVWIKKNFPRSFTIDVPEHGK